MAGFVVCTGADLVARIMNGDRSAEAEIVGAFRCGVFAMLLARTRDLEAARDLSQEVMLAVLCALREGKLRNHYSLPAFVRGTAMHIANKYFQTLGRERGRLAVPAALGLAGPEEVLDFHEQALLVQRELNRLDSTDRTILQLSLGEGLSPAEIAGRLGLKPECVRKRKSRAMHRIAVKVKRLLVARGERR